MLLLVMRIHLLTNTFIWLYAVFRTLISHILDRAEPLLSSSLPLEVITVFQYYNYFANNNVSDLANYLLQLTREGKKQALQKFKFHNAAILLVGTIKMVEKHLKVVEDSRTFQKCSIPKTVFLM